MTFLEALRKARPLIESGRERFVCLALVEIGAPTPTEHEQRINAMLYPRATYDDWLQSNHPSTYSQMQKIGPEAFRQGRLQWIDHMISKEIEK